MDRMRTRPFLEEQRRDQEAAEDEEDVHANKAAHESSATVEGEDRENGDRAHPVKCRSITESAWSCADRAASGRRRIHSAWENRTFDRL
jgi:hypothetical protein